MDNPICFALDVNSFTKAQDFVARLEDHVGAFKIGLELFITAGMLPETKRPIVLDLKLHDIPETVERAVKAGGNLGAQYMTLHIQQRETLERAVKAAEEFKMTLLGVTVLTSMEKNDLSDLGMASFSHGFEWLNPIGDRVHNLMRFGIRCGLRGFVCSPQEVKMIRMNCNEEEQPFLLVPGVRPAGSDTGDQKRVGTPAQAIRDGSDFIVIGRPIRDAADPVKAAQDILTGIEEDLTRPTAELPR